MGFEEESEFLTLDPEIREKLDNIDRMKRRPKDKENTQKQAAKKK